MGQAWCKEKTSKAQDSKSPLDRVFVRCAHRIYPSLKEEGSVLGGATQRVTSSEIGYAGSPPRDVLTRGRSIDSVDRPFQPSDWVDVNLEVPSTPRANSVLTNLTIDTNLYPPTTTPTSIRSNNLKDVTPVPPPRRKKRNRGRPLPPKPDEIIEKTSGNLRHVDLNEEPLYSSVMSNSPRTLVDDYATMDDVIGGCREQSHDQVSTFRSQTNGTRDLRVNEYSKGVMPEGRRTKEIYEHKVNGTGRIISSDVVSGKRLLSHNDRKTSKSFNQHKMPMTVDVHGDDDNDDDDDDDDDDGDDGDGDDGVNDDDINDEYEKFVNGRDTKDSSTPNRHEDIRKRTKEFIHNRYIDDSTTIDPKIMEVNVRPKNYSTVSLPNYDELDVGRHATKRTKDKGEEKGGGIRENEKIRSRRPVRSSTGSLPVESFLLPFSQKTSIRLEDYIQHHGSTENLSEYQIPDGKLPCSDANAKTEFLKYDPSKLEDWDLGDIGNCELNHRQRPLERSGISDHDVVDFQPTRKNTNELEKPVSFGKPIEFVHEDSKIDEKLRERDRYPQEESKEIPKPDRPSMCRESSFCLNQSNLFYSDTIEDVSGSNRKMKNSEDIDLCSNSKRIMIFGRSLSNESEPNDPDEMSCETKELRRSDKSEIIGTISEDTLINYKDKLIEYDEGDLKMMKTPPPSPENKRKSDNMSENEHLTLLKEVLKEEAATAAAAAADGSNFSSMTPSLTELEVALSDMLEKEQNDQENVKNENIYMDKEDNDTDDGTSSSFKNEENETKLIKIEKINSKERLSVSLDDILKPKISSNNNNNNNNSNNNNNNNNNNSNNNNNNNRRKVSFCAWEEKDLPEKNETIVNRYDSTINERSNSSNIPSKSNEDSFEIKKSKDIPTPPRRRHRPSCPSGILKEEQRNFTNGAKMHTDTIEHDDRLI
ncbi:protein PFC0760c-like isoform X1 [Vespa mandarinia]|uniref:protein PFC0760c-like isoform X1 n=1 Tax=Vespa mandarinia TaxID=7446 RepID=UPI00160FD347|nr:protein PFC0760c-like isoform X1 [Vespa mandarinia]